MDRIERNRQVAEENERLIKRGTYEAGGKTFSLSPLSRLQEARIFPPKRWTGWRKKRNGPGPAGKAAFPW